MEMNTETTHWLLESDPSIRWQVMRDVLDAPEADWAAERARLAHEGWCADLLSRQGQDGLWNNSLYNGKWLSTTYSLYLLKLLGLPEGHPQALRGCEQLLAQGLYQGEEVRFSRRQGIQDLGVSALVLSLGCYFGCPNTALPRMAAFLASQQQADGSWLPNETPGAVEYAYEGTLMALEGLMQARRRYPMLALEQAETRGQAFLLAHSLGLEQGEPLKKQWGSFSFPPYWFYDLLTALDYFCCFGADQDPRTQPALDLLNSRRSADGTWKLGARHTGKTYFDMEAVGRPSRWNTLRALRVLRWAEACPICSQLGDESYGYQKYGWEEHDIDLPDACKHLVLVKDLRTSHSERELQLLQCPQCGTYYLYRTDYEYLVNGTEDEQFVTRLTAQQAAEYLG